MHRLLPILCSCILLAACAGDRSGRGGIESTVASKFAPDAANVIEVVVVDEQPVESAELVTPDGQVRPAYQILRDRITEEPGGVWPNLGIGIGVAGGSETHVGTSVGLGFPLGGYGGGPHPPEVRSRARIRVDDMAAYRAGWRDWVVRVRLGEPGAAMRLMQVSAPPPLEAGG